MKLQNVYVGELLNIRKGAVYCDVREAAKLIMRPYKAGIVMSVTYLPDAEEYWIAGIVTGQVRDLQFNSIFISSIEAEKHCDKLAARGIPKRDIVCRALPINTKAEVYPDIKTEEHFACERELTQIKEALQSGLFVSNLGKTVPISVVDAQTDNGTYLSMPEGYRVMDISGPDWTQPEDADAAYKAIAQAQTILRELATIDPDAQPNKLAKLIKLAGRYMNPFDSTPDHNPEESAT